MTAPPESLLSTMLVATKVAVLSLGALVTFLAFRAFRRTETWPLGELAVGFGSITVGCAFGGGIDTLLGLDIRTALVLQAAFTLAGFGVITWSLFAKRTLSRGEAAGSPGPPSR